MTNHVTVVLYTPLNSRVKFRQLKISKYNRRWISKSMMIEYRKITKKLMIHNINIIAMIECCQEIRLVDVNKNYM